MPTETQDKDEVDRRGGAVCDVARSGHGPRARKELRCRTSWDMPTLRYELAFQQADGIHTWGPGRCGHNARGSGFCAGCLQREIDRRDRRDE